MDRVVAVFGSSATKEGSIEWAEAEIGPAEAVGWLLDQPEIR
jgi:hypothetical protein